MTPELLVQSLLNAIGIAMVYVLVALALAILTVGLSGMLVERVVFRPFRAGAVPPFGSARRGRCALSAINQFLDLLGANNLIPGPTSTELAIYLGYVRAGWRGLVRAGVLFITPAMLIVLAFAWVYERYGSTPGAAWALYGVKAVILGIVAIALWGLLKTAIKDTMTGAVGVAALVLFLVGVNPIVVLL